LNSASIFRATYHVCKDFVRPLPLGGIGDFGPPPASPLFSVPLDEHFVFGIVFHFFALLKFSKHSVWCFVSILATGCRDDYSYHLLKIRAFHRPEKNLLLFLITSKTFVAPQRFVLQCWFDIEPPFPKQWRPNEWPVFLV